jgi:1-acyl-sn-glycerol-3-phosphate acyltransferase
MVYALLRLLIRLVSRISMRLETHGLENLIASGPFMATANHLGALDILLVYYLLDRRDIIIFLAERHRKYTIVRWLARQVDAVYVDRFNADMAATREVLKRLRAGGVLVIAPEGTRSRSGQLLEGRQGASYLAAKAGAPILPVGATGTDDKYLVANLKRLRRTPVTVRIGKPFYLPPLPNQEREVTLQAYTDEIMCHIAALLPEKHRGVYADHPRLKELLAAQPT